jgi:hypothetical protein
MLVLMAMPRGHAKRVAETKFSTTKFINKNWNDQPP